MKAVISTVRFLNRIVSDFFIYRRFRRFTMITPRTYILNLLVAERFKSVPGLIVECGVWRGGMMAGIATVFGTGRQYYLFDSFEGLPPAKAADGEAALAWQANKDGAVYFDNCKAEEKWAQDAMKLSGAARFATVKGWFNETLPKFQPEDRIAVLRLDGDWYDSTMECLVHLYPHVVPGGAIIIDDYYTWAGCSRAIHDYLSRNALEDTVHQYLNGVCYFIKKKELAPPIHPSSHSVEPAASIAPAA